MENRQTTLETNHDTLTHTIITLLTTISAKTSTRHTSSIENTSLLNHQVPIFFKLFLPPLPPPPFPFFTQLQTPHLPYTYPKYNYLSLMAQIL